MRQRGEEDKLAAGLHKLHEEDPTFHFEYSSELGQTLIHGMGENHFEIILGRLARKFGVHAELIQPKVAYRETIKGGARARGSTRSRRVAAASTAIAGFGWRPALPRAGGYSSSTQSWEA